MITISIMLGLSGSGLRRLRVREFQSIRSLAFRWHFGILAAYPYDGLLAKLVAESVGSRESLKVRLQRRSHCHAHHWHVLLMIL